MKSRKRLEWNSEKKVEKTATRLRAKRERELRERVKRES